MLPTRRLFRVGQRRRNPRIAIVFTGPACHRSIELSENKHFDMRIRLVPTHALRVSLTAQRDLRVGMRDGDKRVRSWQFRNDELLIRLSPTVVVNIDAAPQKSRSLRLPDANISSRQTHHMPDDHHETYKDKVSRGRRLQPRNRRSRLPENAALVEPVGLGKGCAVAKAYLNRSAQ